MPITRKALLISNPGETGQENYCKGVYVDVEKYHRLLTSPFGGTWDPSDIKHLDRPTVEVLELWIGIVSAYDYALIMFTGHGWYSSTDRDRVLELRKNESVHASDLLRDAKKRTVILDCCQKVYNEPKMIKEARQVEMLNARAAARRAPNAEACRRLFLKEVEDAPTGIVVTTSCSMNEVSTDDDERGGRYNASLIEAAEDWANAQAQKSWVVADALSIVAAHEPAARETQRLSGGTQNPTISKPRTSPYFPFAVFA